ncbi:MAG: HAD family hydrolase [Clostridiales bacterium]|nr:HAD family hydrolase [Clostridiales bacterium]
MRKAVIFDIDDTLYNYKSANVHAMDALCRYVRRELNLEEGAFREDYNRVMDYQMQERGETAGCHSRAIRLQLLLEERGLPLRHAAAMNDLYWNALLDVITPSPGVTELIQALKDRGIRLGVGSDMTADWQLKKLERLGLLDLMDFVVTSEEAGVEKPDPGLFLLCAEKAGCLPEECLFIGDNLKKDVLGAQNAGMEALWLQPDPQKAGEYPSVKSIPGFQGLIDHILFQKEKDS